MHNQFQKFMPHVDTALGLFVELTENEDFKVVFGQTAKSLTYSYLLRRYVKGSVSATSKILNGETPNRKEVIALVGLVQWVPYFVSRSLIQGRRETESALNSLDNLRAAAAAQKTSLSKDLMDLAEDIKQQTSSDGFDHLMQDLNSEFGRRGRGSFYEE